MIVERDGTPAPSQEVAEGTARWLYGPGRPLLRLAASHGLARAYRCWARSRISARRVVPFAVSHGIELPPGTAWRSFAQFFDRGFSTPPVFGDGLTSPSDAKLSAARITEGLQVEVKGARFGLAELLGDAEVAALFDGGLALVFRLTMDEVHRYHFVDDGQVVADRQVAGQLHTVGPASWGWPVLTSNERRWQLLATEELGSLVSCQVGAMLVGSIRNHRVRQFSRGQEQGRFELGGSTIVLLVGPQVVLDDDIAALVATGAEVRVRCGETIGHLAGDR